MRFVVPLVVAVFAGSVYAESPADVAALVEKLGDAKFAVREAAQRELLKRGEDILLELDKLAKTADAEIAERLKKVRYALVGYKDDINRLLKLVEYPALIPAQPVEELQNLIVKHQPRSGDHLLTLLMGRDSLLAQRARQTFVVMWDTASADQIRKYLSHIIRFQVPVRKEYPAGVEATITAEATLGDRGAGWLINRHGRPITFVCRFSRYFDGKAYGKAESLPFGFPAARATIGEFRTTDLPLGEHSIQIAMQYEVTLRDGTVKGEIRSPETRFRTVAADAPDVLAASPNEKLNNEIAKSFEIVETGTPKIVPTEPPDPAKLFKADPWYPQSTWRVAGDRWASLHSPVWIVHNPLPVDLCFDAEIHDLETRKTHQCYSFVVTRDTNVREGAIIPRDLAKFAGDREGFVKVKVVLKPSRRLALSDRRVDKYYAEKIESGELRVRIYPAPPAK